MALGKEIKNKLRNFKKALVTFLNGRRNEENGDSSNDNKKLELQENNTKPGEIPVTKTKTDDYRNNCNNDLEELEYLQAELKLKLKVLKTMRESLMGAEQKKEALEVAIRRVTVLKARSEDLQEQLRRKCASEQSLKKELLMMKN